MGFVISGLNSLTKETLDEYKARECRYEKAGARAHVTSYRNWRDVDFGIVAVYPCRFGVGEGGGREVGGVGGRGGDGRKGGGGGDGIRAKKSRLHLTPPPQPPRPSKIPEALPSIFPGRFGVRYTSDDKPRKRKWGSFYVKGYKPTYEDAWSKNMTLILPSYPSSTKTKPKPAPIFYIKNNVNTSLAATPDLIFYTGPEPSSPILATVKYLNTLGNIGIEVFFDKAGNEKGRGVVFKMEKIRKSCYGLVFEGGRYVVKRCGGEEIRTLEDKRGKGKRGWKFESWDGKVILGFKRERRKGRMGVFGMMGRGSGQIEMVGVVCTLAVVEKVRRAGRGELRSGWRAW